MNRRLIIKMCMAADDVLNYGKSVSYANIRRLVTRGLLTTAPYLIPKNVPITEGDYMLVLQVLREDRRLRGLKGHLEIPRQVRFKNILEGIGAKGI